MTCFGRGVAYALLVAVFVRGNTETSGTPLIRKTTYCPRPSRPLKPFTTSAALEVEKGGEMKAAGMGRGDGVWHGQQSRGDNILWITDGIRGKGDLPEVRLL